MKKFITILALMVCGTTFAATRPPAPVQPALDARVPVLMYHEIVPDNSTIAQSDTVVTVSAFNAQMKWLRDNNYYTIRVSELAAYMANQTTQRTVVGKKPIVITFDDGWYNQLNALPAMRRYGFVATFNIISTLPGNNAAYMNWRKIRSLLDYGHEIGSHSATHPYMMDGVDVYTEVVTSKLNIESKIRQRVRTIAWPGGYFNPSLTALAISSGYIGAQTIDENWCTSVGQDLSGTVECYWLAGNSFGQNPFTMKRLFVDGRCTTAEFGVWVTQMHSSACAAPVALSATASILAVPEGMVEAPLTAGTRGTHSTLRAVKIPKDAKFNKDDDDKFERKGRDRVDSDNDGRDIGRGDDRSRRRHRE